MDPQKVREFDNGLTELNNAVRQSDQTFLDVLGPMASQIRDSLQKENNQAASDQDGVTNQLENSYSKTKQLADKQQSLYQQQLQRRGYGIDQSGREVKVDEELSIRQQELLSKLDKAIAKDSALLQATSKPVEQFKALAGSVTSFSGVFEKLQDKMFEMTGKSVGGAIALQGSIAAITGITKAFGVMSEAIYKGERGASVGAKGAKEFSDSVTKAAYGIGAALMILPLGPMLKIVGAAMAIAAAAMEGATKLTEMGAKLNDDLYKSYGTLSEKGLTTAKGMSGLYDSLHKVGLSAGEIEKFNKLLGENSKNLALFGGTAAIGVSKFEKVASAITAPTSKLNKEFLLMGINSDAQREHIMKYMTEEDRLGLAQGRSEEQQIAGAKKYIDNLDKLSMITGSNRKELEDARATVMANENLRAAIFAAEQDRSEAGQARLAELKRAYEAAAMLQASGDTKGATGVAEYFAGRGITGKASAVAYNQFSGKGGLIEGIKKGADTGELTTRAAKGYERQSNMMADTGRFGGDTSGLMTAGFGHAQEFTKRSAEFQEQAAKQGLSVGDYLDKLQEDKKNTKDKTTQQNAKVAQLQQETAMIIDDAAKKMDGAGLAMASAMKVFNESVELFGEATKKMAKEKVIAIPASPEQQSDDLKKEISKLKESIRIKNQSIENLDPKLEANKAYIARMKSELEVINKDLVNAEQKLTIVTKEQKEKEQKGTAPANLPPGATIPTPPGPPAKDQKGTTPANLPPGTTTPAPTGAPAQSEGGAPDTRSAKAKAPTEGKPKLAQVSSKSGKSTAVNTELAPSFQGLIDYLDGVGYKIYSLGGYVDRDVRGKPGVKSIHAHGAAIDINPAENPLSSQLVTDFPTNISQVAAGLGLGWGGNWKTRKDAMHFSAATGEGGKLLKAKTGAMFEGPAEGYFVQLHGKEFVGNEDQLDAIKKLLDKVEENDLLSDTPETEYVEEASDEGDNSVFIEKFTNMLESKTDELLEKIKFGNRVDTDLLNYSQG